MTQNADHFHAYQSCYTYRLLFFIAGSLIMLFTTVSPAQAQETQYYTVQVTTGRVDGSGTDADVYITLMGTGGKSQPFFLDDPNRDDFENGNVGTYKVSTTKRLGRLTHIKLEHNNAGNGSGWYIDTVDILGPKVGKSIWPSGHSQGNGDYYQFPINRWLATDEDDRKLHVTVQRKDFERTRGQDVIGRPQGQWVTACSGGQKCKTGLKETVEMTRSSEQSFTESAASAFEASLQQGYTTGVGEGSVTMSYSEQKTMEQARSSAKSGSGSVENTCEQEVDMEKYEIHTIWQWQISADLGFGTMVLKTCQVTCTKDHTLPTVPPGHSSLKGRCLGK